LACKIEGKLDNFQLTEYMGTYTQQAMSSVVNTSY
jgi:hypothetical protein